MVTSQYDERAILFECAGERLVGIVASPPKPKLGVMVIVGGPQYRAGSHRHFVLLARRLAEEGAAVMRFDYRGMGDSSGAMMTFEDAVPDVRAALDAFHAACPMLQRVVFWALCDAASLALVYWQATHDARVAGMVLADPWVTSDEAFAESQARHYLRRPFQRDFWLKLLRGGVDIKRAIGDVRSVLSKVRRVKSAPAAPQPYQERMTAGLDAFKAPVLLLLSGDFSAREFMQYCEAHPRWIALLARSNVARGELPEYNHTFAGAAARGDVEKLTIDWLASNGLADTTR
jgi:exosortase A-associated hydrolase 1